MILVEVQAEQTASQNQFQVDLDASRIDNEELRRANEELRRELQCLGECAAGEQTPLFPVRARPMNFFQVIMNVVISTNFMTSKITFTGIEDPNVHITTFDT